MKNDDTKLIQRVLAGDDNAFSVLVRKYQKQVHALAWRKIGDFHIAEEITQDTFLKAYKRLATLKKPQRFASWLYVIAANRCSSWLRKKRLLTQPLEQLEETDNELLQKATYSGYVIEENERTAVAAQRDVVKKLLAKLQESERTVITLHYFGEMSCTEIGAFLGVSANTIKSRLRRAQQHLKKEEPMMREALENFQTTPNLTENIMRKISHIKPAALSNGKPFALWAITTSIIAVVLLMLSIGNHSVEAQTDATVKDYAKWELPKEAKARLGKGGISAIQFSPDGAKLAIGSNIGVWLYNVETGKEISLFPGMCQAIAFSPDGRFLASGGGKLRGQELQLWEIATRRKVPIIGGPFVGSVLRFSEDGKTLVSLNNWGDTISQLDIETGQGNIKHLEERQFTGSRGPEVYALTHDKFAVGNRDGKIQLYDPSTGKMLLTLRGHANLSLQPLDAAPNRPAFPPPHRSENRVLALAFSPNGTHLASGSQDKTVRLWDTTNEGEWTTLQKHTGWTNVLAFSPDGKLLASGSTDTTVQLWNIATGEPLVTLTGHLNSIIALAFSADGNILASGSTDGTVRFWNTGNGDPLSTPITGHTEWVKAVAFSNDGSTLASVAFNGTITFWDVKTSKKSNSQVAGHRDWFTTLAFSPDGTKLASVGAEGDVIFGVISSWRPDPLIRLTEASTGHEIATLMDRMNPSNLTFSPDGKTVVFSTHDKIRLWNIETDSHLDIQRSHPNDVHKLPPDPRGNGDLAIPPGRRFRPMPMISALAFSPDGTRLVSATMEGQVQMWDAEMGIELTSLVEQDPDGAKHEVKDGGMTVTVSYKDPIFVLAFSPNGKRLAAGSQKQIRLWNMGTGNWGKGISSINNRKDGREVFQGSKALVFSPDSTVLVNGNRTGKIQLWDITTGDEPITLNGHMEGVETLQFSPDGNTLVSAAQDGTILLWDWNEIITGLSVKDK